MSEEMRSMGMENIESGNISGGDISGSANSKTVDNARALYYDFLSRFFTYDLLKDSREILQNQIEFLSQQALLSEDEVAFLALKNELEKNGVENVLSEYTGHFMLPFATKESIPESISKKGDGQNKKKKSIRKNPQIMLYLSCYLGNDSGISAEGLLLAKSKVRKSKVRLDSSGFKESEEHFGFLLFFMRYLIQNGEENLSIELFDECIKPMYRGIADGVALRDECIYSHVCKIMSSFLELESSFNM